MIIQMQQWFAFIHNRSFAVYLNDSDSKFRAESKQAKLISFNMWTTWSRKMWMGTQKKIIFNFIDYVIVVVINIIIVEII